MKDKIKVGDTVAHENNLIDGVVSEMCHKGIGLRLKDSSNWYLAERFRVVDTSKHHKHHDSIVAWAKGAEIETQCPVSTRWKSVTNPCWFKTYRYRIKPTSPTELELLEEKYKELGDAITKLKENK